MAKRRTTDERRPDELWYYPGMRLFIILAVFGFLAGECSQEETPPPPIKQAPGQPPPESPEKRLRLFAPLFCGKVLAGDRAFMGAHIRIPLAVQTITSENYGNPKVARNSVTTLEGVAELKPCQHLMGLDPAQTEPGMPPHS